jgi:hypothetical protein
MSHYQDNSKHGTDCVDDQVSFDQQQLDFDCLFNFDDFADTSAVSLPPSLVVLDDHEEPSVELDRLSTLAEFAAKESVKKVKRPELGSEAAGGANEPR